MWEYVYWKGTFVFIKKKKKDEKTEKIDICFRTILFLNRVDSFDANENRVNKVCRYKRKTMYAQRNVLLFVSHTAVTRVNVA